MPFDLKMVLIEMIRQNVYLIGPKKFCVRSSAHHSLLIWVVFVMPDATANTFPNSPYNIRLKLVVSSAAAATRARALTHTHAKPNRATKYENKNHSQIYIQCNVDDGSHQIILHLNEMIYRHWRADSARDQCLFAFVSSSFFGICFLHLADWKAISGQDSGQRIENNRTEQVADSNFNLKQKTWWHACTENHIKNEIQTCCCICGSRFKSENTN